MEATGVKYIERFKDTMIGDYVLWLPEDRKKEPGELLKIHCGDCIQKYKLVLIAIDGGFRRCWKRI